MENFNIGQSYKETFVKVSRNTLLELLQAENMLYDQNRLCEKKIDFYLVRQSRTRRN